MADEEEANFAFDIGSIVKAAHADASEARRKELEGKGVKCKICSDPPTGSRRQFLMTPCFPMLHI